MDWLHVQGMNLIYELQHGLKDHKEFMLWLSHVGSPRISFLLYFPVVVHINRSAGVRLLWLASVSEWINAILKWFLHGERPYWWIHETKWYNEPKGRELDQFHLTCETGPGSPSGHAMVTAAVLYILVKEVIYPAVAKTSKSRTLAGMVSWLAYALIIILICVSRCFIAAHFPHQVLCGSVVGVLLAYMSYQISVDTISLTTYILTSLLFLLVAVVTYLLVQLAGIDPLWSMTLAQTWCPRKDWIHLDTTLFASIIRDASCLLGLGLGLAVVNAPVATEDQKRPVHLRVVYVVLSVCIMHGSQTVNILQDSPALFYSVYAVVFSIMILIVICIPNLLKSVFQFRKINENKTKNG